MNGIDNDNRRDPSDAASHSAESAIKATRGITSRFTALPQGRFLAIAREPTELLHETSLLSAGGSRFIPRNCERSPIVARFIARSSRDDGSALLSHEIFAAIRKTRVNVTHHPVKSTRSLRLRLARKKEKRYIA